MKSENNPEESIFIDAVLLHRQGLYNEALIKIEECILKEGNEYFFWSEKVAILIKLGNYDAALTSVQMLSSMRPQNGFPYIYLSTIYKHKQLFQDALNASLIATQIEPALFSSWSSLGDSYRLVKRFQDSLNAYDTAIDLLPKDFDSHIGKGLTLQELGFHSSAQHSFLIAYHLSKREFGDFLPKYIACLENIYAPFWTRRIYYELYPELFINNYNMKIISQAENDSKEALLVLTIISNQQWTQFQKNRAEGIVHYYMGDPIKSAEIFKPLAFTQQGNYLDIYYLILSKMSFQNEKCEELVRAKEMMDLIELSSSDFSQLYYVGHIYSILGEVEKAYRCFNKINAQLNLNDNFLPALYMELYLLDSLEIDQKLIVEIVDKIFFLETHFYEIGGYGFVLNIHEDLISDDGNISWRVFHEKYLYYLEIAPAIWILMQFNENNPRHPFNNVINYQEASKQLSVKITFQKIKTILNNYVNLFELHEKKIWDEFEKNIFMKEIIDEQISSDKFERICTTLLENIVKEKIDIIIKLIIWGVRKNKITNTSATYLLLYSIWIQQDIYLIIANDNKKNVATGYTILTSVIGAFFCNSFISSLIVSLGFSSAFPIFGKFLDNIISKPHPIIDYYSFKNNLLNFVSDLQEHKGDQFYEEFKNNNLIICS